MNASLPMYWRAETAAAHTAFWSRLQRLISLPDLSTPEALPMPWSDHWLTPDLTLSMTCGLPFRTALKGKVGYVGTFDYGLEDCPPGYYRSVIVAKSPVDWSRARLACNGFDSQSGWAAALEAAGDTPPENVVLTGGHAASLEAVAQDRADVAAIDAITWRLMERFDPNASLVSVQSVTEPTPGLPLIAAKGFDASPIYEALAAAIADSPTEELEAMGGLRGITRIPIAAYHGIPVPPDGPAVASPEV
ncbi:MAG: phosphate/phosphite/phosphonate ABC transporter substrate-binding protein [Shimia sp.]